MNRLTFAAATFAVAAPLTLTVTTAPAHAADHNVIVHKAPDDGYDRSIVGWCNGGVIKIREGQSSADICSGSVTHVKPRRDSVVACRVRIGGWAKTYPHAGRWMEVHDDGTCVSQRVDGPASW